MNVVWILSLLSTFLILLDQFTKFYIQDHFYLGESVTVIPDFFYFTYVRNPGAAFGFMADGNLIFKIILFKIVPVLACFWLAYMVMKINKSNKILATSYTLIFSGAVGNLFDRFMYNYVVDFFDFKFGLYHWPAFNIADSSIFIGGILLIVDFYFESKKSMKNIKKKS